MRLVDKIQVKEHINTIALDVRVPKIIWRGRSFSQIDFSAFPKNYVLKSNYASETNLIIRNGNHPRASSLVKMEKIRHLKNICGVSIS